MPERERTSEVRASWNLLPHIRCNTLHVVLTCEDVRAFTRKSRGRKFSTRAQSLHDFAPNSNFDPLPFKWLIVCVVWVVKVSHHQLQKGRERERKRMCATYKIQDRCWTITPSHSHTLSHSRTTTKHNTSHHSLQTPTDNLSPHLSLSVNLRRASSPVDA